MNILANKYMGVDDLSHYIGISMSMIYKLVRANKIPHGRVETLIKFDVKDIDAWMSQNKIEQISQ